MIVYRGAGEGCVLSGVAARCLEYAYWARVRGGAEIANREKAFRLVPFFPFSLMPYPILNPVSLARMGWIQRVKGGQGGGQRFLRDMKGLRFLAAHDEVNRIVS